MPQPYQCCSSSYQLDCLAFRLDASCKVRKGAAWLQLYKLDASHRALHDTLQLGEGACVETNVKGQGVRKECNDSSWGRVMSTDDGDKSWGQIMRIDYGDRM